MISIGSCRKLIRYENYDTPIIINLKVKDLVVPCIIDCIVDKISISFCLSQNSHNITVFLKQLKWIFDTSREYELKQKASSTLNQMLGHLVAPPVGGCPVSHFRPCRRLVSPMTSSKWRSALSAPSGQYKNAYSKSIWYILLTQPLALAFTCIM